MRKTFLVSAETLMHRDVMNKLPQDFQHPPRHFEMSVNDSEEIPHVVKFVLLLGKFCF